LLLQSRQAAQQRRQLGKRCRAPRPGGLHCSASSSAASQREPADAWRSGGERGGSGDAPLWRVLVRHASKAALLLGLVAAGLCRPPVARARCGALATRAGLLRLPSPPAAIGRRYGAPALALPVASSDCPSEYL